MLDLYNTKPPMKTENIEQYLHIFMYSGNHSHIQNITGCNHRKCDFQLHVLKLMSGIKEVPELGRMFQFSCRALT